MTKKNVYNFFFYLYVGQTLMWFVSLFGSFDIYMYVLGLGDKADQGVVYLWFGLVLLSALSIVFTVFMARKYLKKARLCI